MPSGAPLFCALKFIELGSLWGAVTNVSDPGPGCAGPETPDLQAFLTEATTGIEPV